MAHRHVKVGGKTECARAQKPACEQKSCLKLIYIVKMCSGADAALF